MDAIGIRPSFIGSQGHARPTGRGEAQNGCGDRVTLHCANAPKVRRAKTHRSHRNHHPMAGCQMAIAMSLAAFGVPGLAVAQTPVPPPAASLSQVIPGREQADLDAPIVTNPQAAVGAGVSTQAGTSELVSTRSSEQASATVSTSAASPSEQAAPPSGQAPSQAGSTPGGQQPELTAPSWYSSLEHRDRDINDGFGGIGRSINGWTARVNDALNPEAITRFGAHGTIGDREWRFQPLQVRVDPYLTTRLNKIGAGVRGEASFLGFQVDRREDDTIRGVRGDLYFRHDVGRTENFSMSDGLYAGEVDNGFFGPRVEWFQRRQTQDGHWNRLVDFNVGASDDIGRNVPLVYARAIGRWDNDQITDRWLGEKSRLRLEAEAGVQYNLASAETEPFYRTFAGAMKPFTISKHEIELELGVQARGRGDDMFDLSPQARARVHW